MSILGEANRTGRRGGRGGGGWGGHPGRGGRRAAWLGPSKWEDAGRKDLDVGSLVAKGEGEAGPSRLSDGLRRTYHAKSGPVVNSKMVKKNGVRIIFFWVKCMSHTLWEKKTTRASWVVQFLKVEGRQGIDR